MFYQAAITKNKFECNPGEEMDKQKSIQNITSPFDNL
jgi:hypothetical protein